MFAESLLEWNLGLIPLVFGPWALGIRVEASGFYVEGLTGLLRYEPWLQLPAVAAPTALSLPDLLARAPPCVRISVHSCVCM